MQKLNLGCGVHRAGAPGEDWINVDKYDSGQQDLIFDVEKTPWPWADNSVDAALFNHSMEHMGQDPNVFLAIMKELYRVCCDGATVFVNVPHHRHDEFFGDPTHVRPILADTFILFSQKANQVFREKNGANSCFAFLLGVDFEVAANQLVLDERFAYLKDDPSWQRMAAINNNVIREVRIELRVIKNGTSPSL